MEWFEITVELPESGIRGVEYVEAISPGEACNQIRERQTVRPVSVRSWRPETTTFVHLRREPWMRPGQVREIPAHRL